MFSIPAKCFLKSLATKHRMDLHASYRGKLVGFQWRYQKALDCSGSPEEGGAWPATSEAKVLLPKMGQDMSVLQAMAAAGATHTCGRGARRRVQ